MIEHQDEAGQACTRHGTLSEQRMMELATLGSRMPAFHHDAASKLQSLMMALDEISELASGDASDMRSSIDTAHSALRELNQLLTANRALAKAPQPSRIALPELLQRAAESTGVRIRTPITAKDVRAHIPALRHALALLLDLTAGPSHLGRVVDATCEFEGDRYVLRLSGPPEAQAKLPVNAGESIGIATFVIDREDGTVRCTPTGFVVTLPAAIAPTGAMPALSKP
ncbi:MAG: hypothetical protein JO257_26375 [Deltaproteobacteria bacterium]|nr:hypothetical protein [Deltaproteobacteria bacterium]